MDSSEFKSIFAILRYSCENENCHSDIEHRYLANNRSADQVETWTYQNINSVFHNPDTLELSHEEKMELAKKQKIIKHDNTRLTKLPWKTDKQVRAS
jgi:hypothetical protein